MDGGALIASFRADTDDYAIPPLWPDTEVLRFLAEAEDEGCIRGGLIFDNSSAFCTIAIAAGEQTKTLDALILSIDYASLTDAAGNVYVLNPTDRIEMDRTRPDWRTAARRPDGFIHDDKTLTLNAPADAAYTLKLEVRRLPLVAIDSADSVPEIHAMHHRHLVQWALHRAYSKPDTETLNKGKAEEAEARFEKYFGPRPDASIRRKQLANRPHHNKPCW